MWTISHELQKSEKVRIAPAFSEESLVQSMGEGTLDEESFNILKKFSSSRSNVNQYMNSTKGTVLLRSATLSTGIELPAIDEMRRAEILFGPQKDYYHNAEQVLNERDNLKKDKMRNAITLGRIEHNVKKVGSMIHLLDPLHVDDVKIPSDNKAVENAERALTEERRMQVRLLHSSSVLPAPNKELPGAPDHATLNKFRATKLDQHAVADATRKQMHAKPADFDPLRRDDEPKMPVIEPKYAHNIHFLNQLGNKRRPLDKQHLSIVLDKVAEATHPEHHDRYDLHYAYNNSPSKIIKQNLPQAAKEALERKVRNALRDEYNDRIRVQNIIDKNKASKDRDEDLVDSKPGTASAPRKAESPNKIVLDTRSLLPFYKAEDVRHFMDIFSKVDTDFSGDLDMDEWVRLFSSINTNISEQESISIFMKFKNDKGFLTVNELIPIVFSKATKEQLKLITKFCLAEIMRPSNETVVLTFAEVDQLFEIYDAENLGFVAVGHIKEKIRDMALSENVVQSFLSNIKDIDEDEMVNHREFGRMFKHLVNKIEIAAQRDEEMRQDKNSASRGGRR